MGEGRGRLWACSPRKSFLEILLWGYYEPVPLHLIWSTSTMRGVKSLNYLRQTCVQRSIRDFVNTDSYTALLNLGRTLCIFSARFAIDHGTFGDNNFVGTPALVGHSLKLLDQVPQCSPAWLRHWLQVIDQSLSCHGNFGPAKIWSSENLGPGDQNSRKIWSAGLLLFSEKFGPRVE